MARVSIKSLLPLAGLMAVPALAQNAAVTVAIDATVANHPINPLIYGVSFGAAADLAALNAPINRMGGNTTSTYAWKLNADNHDDDYFFESLPETSTVAGALADSFIQTSQSAGAKPMVTIPMIGYVAKLGPDRGKLSSFSIAKYGAQCSVDPYDTDAGDGLKTDCATPITGNTPGDAYTADSPTLEQAWVQHLVTKWGGAAKGGLSYYLLDNEPSIWYSTHRDIKPVGTHATTYEQTVVTYSKAIKAIDPNALIVAPEEWGWNGYLYSGYDQQYSGAHGYTSFPDLTGEQGGVSYLPWLLQRWKAAGHPIDVLSVHFYPQGGEFSDDTTAATQLLRNRSTRQLWDPNYVSESWIDEKVYLIPRLEEMITSDYYTGTPVAITEYNWGAESSINGATTQADIFGIFGREGLDIATRWTVPDASTPTYKAMQMYRNYDTHHSTFGDTSVSTKAPNPDNVAAFAATRKLDGALTIVVINKVLSGNTPVTLNVAHFTGAASARAYRLTSANAIATLANAAFTNGKITATLPPQSITIYVLPASGKALAAWPNAVMSETPATPYAPAPGQTVAYKVSFAGTQSTAARGSTITGYSWDFGDGTTATTESAAHSYTAYGSYTAKLTVAGGNGLVSVAEKVISVLPKLATVTACTVAFTNTDDWGSGFTGDLKVTNAGAGGINYWTLAWSFPSGETLTDIWNATGSQSGATVNALPAAWDQSIGAGANIDIGFNANYTSASKPPTGFKLNGTACSAG